MKRSNRLKIIIFLLIVVTATVFLIRFGQKVRFRYYTHRIINTHRGYPECAMDYLEDHLPLSAPFLLKAYEEKLEEYIDQGVIVGNLSGLIGDTDCAEAIPIILRSFFAISDPLIRENMILSVKRLNKQKEVSSFLVKLLDSEHPTVRKAAVGALVTFNCKDVVPHLEEMKQDENEMVREAVQNALDRLTQRDQKNRQD